MSIKGSAPCRPTIKGAEGRELHPWGVHAAIALDTESVCQGTKLFVRWSFIISRRRTSDGFEPIAQAHKFVCAQQLE